MRQIEQKTKQVKEAYGDLPAYMEPLGIDIGMLEEEERELLFMLLDDTIPSHIQELDELMGECKKVRLDNLTASRSIEQSSSSVKTSASRKDAILGKILTCIIIGIIIAAVVILVLFCLVEMLKNL